MKEQPTSKDDNELIQRVCRGVASIQEGERLRAYIAGLQSALERSQHQITMLLGARAPVETADELYVPVLLCRTCGARKDVNAHFTNCAEVRAQLKATEPTWEDLRGIAPDATGTLSSEEFVRETRNAWDQK